MALINSNVEKPYAMGLAFDVPRPGPISGRRTARPALTRR